MKKKIVIIVTLFVILIGISALICSNKIKNYQNKINTLNKENNALKENINNLKQEKNNKCTYTRTYRYIEDYDYKGEFDNYRYIVVDMFQDFKPMILMYNSSSINVNLEKNTYYEITFETFLVNNKKTKETINSIVKTEKQGLDQIQEEC